MIDAHVHLWDRRVLDYPWMADVPSLPMAALPAQFRRDVEGYVVVEADPAPGQAVAEVRWISALARAGAPVRAIVAHARLGEPTAAAELIELARWPLVRGVRRVVQNEPDGFVLSAAFGRDLDRVADRGWVFEACVRHGQLPDVAALVHRHPQLTVVLDHLGKPPLHRPGMLPWWQEQLDRMAAVPSTVVKLSGILADVPGPLSPDAVGDLVGPWIAQAWRIFGPERCLVASDWPVSTGERLSPEAWEGIVREVTGADDDAWDAATRRVAQRVYGY